MYVLEVYFSVKNVHIEFITTTTAYHASILSHTAMSQDNQHAYFAPQWRAQHLIAANKAAAPVLATTSGSLTTPLLNERTISIPPTLSQPSITSNANSLTMLITASVAVQLCFLGLRVISYALSLICLMSDSNNNSTAASICSISSWASWSTILFAADIATAALVLICYAYRHVTEPDTNYSSTLSIVSIKTYILFAGSEILSATAIWVLIKYVNDNVVGAPLPLDFIVQYSLYFYRWQFAHCINVVTTMPSVFLMIQSIHFGKKKGQ